MLSKQQLEQRKHGIGASEISSVCGLTPFVSALQVYLIKRGIEEPADLSDNQAVEWGNRLEGVVAEKYAETLGVTLTRLNKTYVHAKNPWMMCTPDAEIFDDFEVGGIIDYGLEVKTAGERSAFRWGKVVSDDDGHRVGFTFGDDMPQEYLVQCAWSCAVRDCDRWDLAVLIGGKDYRPYTYHRDISLEQRIIAIGRKFWEGVQNGIPPDPDASESAKKALVGLYPEDQGEIIAVTNGDLGQWIEQLRVSKDAEKKSVIDKREAENHIKKAIGDNAGIETASGDKFTWKKNKDGKKVHRDDLARELGATHEQVKLHTIVTPGARVFRAKFAD